MKEKSTIIVPVLKYGDEAINLVKDNFIKMAAENIVTVPAIEGMVEKKLTKAGALDLYSKYKEFKDKGLKNISIGISEDVLITSKTLRFLKENANLLISPKNPIQKENFSINEANILIVDLHNYYHRIYYAVPEEINVKGETVTLLNHLKRLLSWAIKKYDYILFANDNDKSIRKADKITVFLEKYGYEGGYKGKRKEKEPKLIEQIEKCNFFLKEKGYKILEVDGYEADDIIASAIKKILPYTTFSNIHILSSDKDLFQILKRYPNYEQTNINIFHPKEKNLMDRNYCIQKFGIEPEWILDYFALKGDPTDSVPGAKGIGRKTAQALIQDYKTIENIFSKIDEIDPKIREKLIKSKPLIMVSRDLIYLRENLFESVKVEDILNKIQKGEK